MGIVRNESADELFRHGVDHPLSGQNHPVEFQYAQLKRRGNVGKSNVYLDRIPGQNRVKLFMLSYSKKLSKESLKSNNLIYE